MSSDQIQAFHAAAAKLNELPDGDLKTIAFQLLMTGDAVTRLAPGAGIIRMRDGLNWRLVESQSPHEPEAPPLYYCGEASSAQIAAEIHRKAW